MSEKRYLVIHTEIGMIAAEVVEELEDRVLAEMGKDQLVEVLNEEIVYDEETNSENVHWW